MVFSTDAANIQVGVSVLAACWRQYSSLILLEDRTLVSNPGPVVEHWCGALQVTIQIKDVVFVIRRKYCLLKAWLEIYGFLFSVSLSSIGHKLLRSWMQARLGELMRCAAML